MCHGQQILEMPISDLCMVIHGTPDLKKIIDDLHPKVVWVSHSWWIGFPMDLSIVVP